MRARRRLAPEVQELLDKQQIRDLLARYSRGADRADWDAVRDCFTEDATDDHGVVKGTAADLIAYASVAEATWRGRMHSLLQQYVEVDGETARGETYALTSRRCTNDDGLDEDVLTGLRYVDKFTKVEGRWKIAERVTVLEWNTAIPSCDWLPVDQFVRGRRDRDDVSYSFGLP